MPDNSGFVKSLEDAQEQIIERLERNMDRACLIVEEEAKKRCPVDMGILRASIASEVEVTEAEVIGIIGDNLEYAPYVHNGTGIYAKDGNGRKTPWGYEVEAGKHKGFHWTRGQRPKPFLEDAKLAKRSSVERILGA